MSAIRLIVIGAGQRGEAYACFAVENPVVAKVVAVVDPDPKRRTFLGNLCGVKSQGQFATGEEALTRPRFADAVIIATPDRTHVEPALAALRAGYDVLIEKPISDSVEECLALSEAARDSGRSVVVCHVLRYSPFFSELKRIITSGAIGDIMSIHHSEEVGYWHQAHSYVRGNWRRTAESSPMILAKCCHDMDILLWLIDSPCRAVASFGGLAHFKPSNAPAGAPERCTDGCSLSTSCPYDAQRYYLTDPEHWAKKILRKVVAIEGSDEAVLAALRTGPYGRCVYHCDNDVVDHQASILEFCNGATVSFTMSAFNRGGRHIDIMGTKGQLKGDMESGKISHFDFLTDKVTNQQVFAPAGGHNGGDSGIMADFCAFLRTGDKPTHLSTIETSIESHLMALAAEESRLLDRTVLMAEFENVRK